MTRGLRPTLVFAPSFFFVIRLSPSVAATSAWARVLSLGVDALGALESVSPSSSTPKESLPLPATLRFFLNRGLGVDALCFAN
jgi:hypothetical protein